MVANQAGPDIQMRIGVDFDNTLIRYDEVFHRVALEQELIPSGFPAKKKHIRDSLRQAGREDEWTEIQGNVYGKRIVEAQPFEGALSFMRECVDRAVDLFVISHKTQYPYKGKKYDLRKAANRWLSLNGVFDPDKIGFCKGNVFYESSKKDKIERIKNMKCTHFIDDLPEFLSEPDFPVNVRRILFDPDEVHENSPKWVRVNSWKAVQSLIFQD